MNLQIYILIIKNDEVVPLRIHFTLILTVQINTQMNKSIDVLTFFILTMITNLGAGTTYNIKINDNVYVVLSLLLLVIFSVHCVFVTLLSHNKSAW